MTNFKIFLHSGKLMIGEFPEEPDPRMMEGIDKTAFTNACEKYNAVVEAAKKNAVEVVNPEVIITPSLQGGQWVHKEGNKYDKLEEGRLYDLPPGWTVEFEDTMSPGWVPSYNDPDNRGLAEPAEPIRIARLIPAKASGIVSTGIADQDSPVIPEGSEKAEAYDTIITCAANAIMFLSRVQHGLVNGRQRDAVKNEARDAEYHFNRMLTEMRLGGIADKPAIDDTLKGPHYLTDGLAYSYFRMYEFTLRENKELRKLLAAQPPPQAESQDELWRDIEYHYIFWIDEQIKINELKRDFTITRKP